ncbi:MAG: hypothetical protein HYW93_01385, partial [Thaumarchaeota archaeon]|nr:hypothetical protein [Nitrososphaerota archaeon]
MAYVDGVLDVGVLVPVCFENPLKRESIAFLAEVLEQRRRAFIPVTSVLGAYHITTRYLGIPRVSVNRMLREVLTSGSAALYPELSPTVAADALDYASTYGMESWDGHLI